MEEPVWGDQAAVRVQAEAMQARALAASARARRMREAARTAAAIATVMRTANRHRLEAAYANRPPPRAGAGLSPHSRAAARGGPPGAPAPAGPGTPNCPGQGA
ncbi:hypothetical protein [Streptomyces sp. NPDC046939]|uniref:hypothetical protein n=1 Tax=Streptomyces sp. NPDC046939 TaxID=3155376 RepID=UPI003402A7AC